jgi:glycosyltransferase involved in cell wall biosynthesis
MRLALVVTGGVDRSGTERVIPTLLALVDRLAGVHDVAVYVLRYHDRPCSYPLLGAVVHDLGRPRGLPRQYLALVRALRRDGPFDVVHAMWAMPAGVVAACAGRRLGVPVVVTADSGEFVALPEIDYGLQRKRRHRLAVRVATRLAARVTVCTEYMDRLARPYGVTPDIVPLGVDCTVFRPAREPWTGAIADGPPWRLLHVASLNPVKNQALLLEAFRHLLDLVPPGTVRLDVVGEDTMGDAVQAAARRLGLDRHVTFHGGLPTSAVVPLYQQAHLVVISSRHEAACAVVLEAAASGVPVVGTDVGYVHDWSPSRALAVPRFDPVALGDAMAALLGDPARRRALAAAAREWASAHDAGWTAARFVALYQELSVTRQPGTAPRAHRSDTAQ